MKKQFFALLAAFLTCVTLGTVSACNKNKGNSSSGGGLTGDEMMCTVTVKSEGGMRMAGVTVCAMDADGNVVKEATVGANGKANFYLDDGEYSVKLKNLPLGYYQTSFGQKISNSSPDASVTLGIELVDEDDRPTGFKYNIGDVMHDFTVPTLDGGSLTLSEILEEKDMVFLNFWYTTCSPCLTEMPWMNNAYNDERYAGDFEMIAIHNSAMATVEETTAFVENTNWTFNFSHSDLTNLEKYFVIGGYPTTVIIDRYGVVTLCETGRLENQNECNDLIAKHLGNDYTQKFAYGGATTGGETDGGYERPEVTVASPDNATINRVLGTSGLTYTPDADPYVWPFIVQEVDGRECLMASNGPTLGVDAHRTSAALNVKVNVPECDDYTDYTFTFDYKISSEYEADFLYVLVDGVIVQEYSGPDMIPDDYGNLYVPAEWKTSYAYVPVRSGEHTLSFVYYKDGSTSDGEDTVYIDNLRFAPIGEGQTYVYRDAVTNRNNENDGFKIGDDPIDAPRFDNYANVYFNEEDKLYHVHSVDGPLLLANLMDTSSNWSKYPLWNYLAVGDYLQYTDGGEVINLKPVVEEFANAELQSLNDYVSVTQELKEFLEFITIQFGSGYENEWLEFCCYYDAYNIEQMENPCAGVNFRYAIEISNEGMDVISAETRATVNLRVALNPRGYRYEFTPTVSGVYRINSDTSISADPSSLLPMVWFTEKNYKTNEDGDPIFWLESTGFNFQYRLEAGVTYYIAAADFDPDKLGDKYEIVITFLGNDTLYELNACAKLPYENILDGNGNVSQKIEAKGISWGIDDKGYVRELRNDNSFGSYIYVDMVNITQFIDNYSLKEIIEKVVMKFDYDNDNQVDKTINAFDFTGLKIDTTGDGILDTEVVDKNGNSYGNCLEKMKGYLAQATAKDAELKGYAKVTEELRTMLELFTEQIHDEYIRNAWQTMCYYYREV